MCPSAPPPLTPSLPLTATLLIQLGCSSGDSAESNAQHILQADKTFQQHATKQRRELVKEFVSAARSREKEEKEAREERDNLDSVGTGGVHDMGVHTTNTVFCDNGSKREFKP